MFCLDTAKVAFASLWIAMLIKCVLLLALTGALTFTCAFMPGRLMSHNWLPTLDCKLHYIGWHETHAAVNIAGGQLR